MRNLQLSVQTPSAQHSKPAVSTPVTPPGHGSELESQSSKDKDILLFTDSLEIHYDPQNNPIQYGHGAWSTVYKAFSIPDSTPSSSSLLTPPSSPATTPRIVAVKSPVRRDAHPVLEEEARTLTRLTFTLGSERHLVPFCGFIPRAHALVMSAVPVSLAMFVEEQARVAREEGSTGRMFEPVLGMRRWCGLGGRLISGLEWLHEEAEVVHGDIKPHNILLRAVNGDKDENDFPYDPLFVDFSSSHDLTTTTTTAPTALTPPFTAPELLSLPALKSPTPPSDIFSLAVTLLAAATGDLLLYPGTSHMQRLAMAREGHRVIEFARGAVSGGCRVPREGVVERVVGVGVCREPGGRVRAGEWLGILNECMGV